MALVVVASGVLLRDVARNAMRISNGYGARVACSAVFVSGRALEDEMTRFTFPPIRFVSRLQVDYGKKCVTAFARLAPHLWTKACWKSRRFGCTLDSVDDGFIAQELSSAQHVPINYNQLEAELDKKGGGGFPIETHFPLGEKIDTIAQQKVRESIDFPRLSSAVEAHFNDTRLHARAFLLVKDGSIVLEKYGDGYTPEKRLLGWSMSKSVLSTLLAIRLQEGGVPGGLDSGVGIEQFSGDERSKITVKNLLRMSDGLDFDEFYSPLGDVPTMLFRNPDLVMANRTRMRTKPEEKPCFQYSSHSTNVLSAFLRSTFATHEDYLKFPHETLFPKVMPSAVFETDPTGTFVGSSFVWAVARDWARFGLLMLSGGNFGGERLLPESFVQLAQQAAPTSDGVYGSAQFWGHLPRDEGDTKQELERCNKLYPSRLDPDRGWIKRAFPSGVFFAHGFEEQIVLIAPQANLVMVRLGQTKEVVLNWDKVGLYQEIMAAAGVQGA